MVPAFYDGDGTWRVRFSPSQAGQWTYHVSARPHDSQLTLEGTLEVSGSIKRGFLQSTPGRAWGFHYESGEPCFFLGDTVYNLFGMAYCGVDVLSFMQRRAEQGFNLLRVRLPVSMFHPPHGINQWQTRSTWPWGGSEQAPVFHRFNLGYFHTVDQVVHQAAALGLNLEMIMEAWGFEFPFNNRQIFLPEWEELWMQYLIARYDAFANVACWTLMNEYEYYPKGEHYMPMAAHRWAMRMGRFMKRTAPHGHIVAIHNGPQTPAFAERFAADIEVIDTIMFQDWGTHDAEQGWLAAGIEETIDRALDGWPGTAIFAEYGYEHNPALPPLVPIFDHCNAEHTRRGAWRGAFRALSVIHGFENSWGPVALLTEDQPGLQYLLHLRHFFTVLCPFDRLRPDRTLLLPAEYPPGHGPLALAAAQREVMAIYFPVAGSAEIAIAAHQLSAASWYDPQTGAQSPAQFSTGQAGTLVATPEGADSKKDWVLLLTAA